MRPKSANLDDLRAWVRQVPSPEELRAWLMESMENNLAFTQLLAERDAARASSMPMEQRLLEARSWVWEVGQPNDDWDGSEDEGPYVVGSHPDLTVRCAEDDHEEGPSCGLRCAEGHRANPCGERMARFWNTPLGHYGEVRQAPGHRQNMLLGNMAMSFREEGKPDFWSRRAASAMGKPAIFSVLLEALVGAGKGAPFGCHRDHGNMVHPAEDLIAECDSPRRKLHLYPARWRNALN